MSIILTILHLAVVVSSKETTPIFFEVVENSDPYDLPVLYPIATMLIYGASYAIKALACSVACSFDSVELAFIRFLIILLRILSCAP